MGCAVGWMLWYSGGYDDGRSVHAVNVLFSLSHPCNPSLALESDAIVHLSSDVE